MCIKRVTFYQLAVCINLCIIILHGMDTYWEGGNVKEISIYKYLVLTIPLIERSTQVDYDSERGWILQVVPIPFNDFECFVTNLHFYIGSCNVPFVLNKPYALPQT